MAKTNRAKARKRRHKRVRKTIYGMPERPRLNVFRSLTDIYVQVIDDEEGKTIAAASTVDKDIRGQMKGKTKTEQAELVGKAIADRAKSVGVTKVIFDRGGYRYIGRIKSLADGAREGGLEF